MPRGVRNTNPAVHKVPRLTKDGSKVARIRIQCSLLLKIFIDIGKRRDERYHLKYETVVYVPFSIFKVCRDINKGKFCPLKSLQEFGNMSFKSGFSVC